MIDRHRIPNSVHRHPMDADISEQVRRKTPGQGLSHWSQRPGTNQKSMTDVVTEVVTEVEPDWNGTEL